jgi:hypothetical protein
MRLMRKILAVFVFLLGPQLLAYSTGFEPPAFLPGDINGQNGWGYLDNSPTGGFIEPVPQPGTPLSFGTQALAIRTRKAEFFPVANNLFSATLPIPAGETGSKAGGVVVPSTNSHFVASLWYRAPDVPVVSTRPDGRIAELDPSSKGTNLADPANRYAIVRLYNDPSGKVRVEINWYSKYLAGPPVDAVFETAIVGYLNWGEWYRFEYLIALVDGEVSPGFPNDRFNLRIFNAADVLQGSACGSTLESPYRIGAFGGGIGARAIDGFDFWAVTGPNGTLVGYVDEFSMNSFTPPDPTLHVTFSGNATVCEGATTTLTANAGGGGGAITGFTWLDASDNVVGTGSSFAARAGTFRVRVSDSLCSNATSISLTVTELPPVAVSISGPASVCCYQKVPLQANPSGGSGAISAYEWRDAQNGVVGTGPSFDASPGTYTVRVTDSSCGTAISQPFTIAAAAAPANVPALSNFMLACMALGLSVLAWLRMR